MQRRDKKSTEKNLVKTMDSILIRKNRLRRIISGGKLPSSEGEEGTEVEGHDGGEGRTKKGESRGIENVAPTTYACPVSSWNLNEDCLLDAFVVLFDEVEQHRNKDQYGHFFLNKFQPVVKEVKRMRVNLNDFQMGKLMAKGSFCTVSLVKEKSNGRRFVMKSYDKSHPKVKESLHLLDAELWILSKNASQWIVSFIYGFHDPYQVHLVLEYMSGGTFRSLLERHGGQIDQDVGRFYFGEMIMAINAVHSLGFAHRNVKPENLLVDSLGHLKISGFGSASKISKNGKVTSPLAVDEASYEAPEILQTLGNQVFTYGVECDFWSLGVIAYEAIFGQHPFVNSSGSLTTFRKITTPRTRENPIGFPSSENILICSKLKDLISGLLVGQEERLTYEDCVRHPFFNALIWDGIRNEVALSIPPLVKIEDDDFSQDVPSDRAEVHFRPLSNVAFVGFTKIQSEDQQTSVLEASSLNESSVISVNAWKTSTLDSKLKSELELKTESLKEKLNEIQILQTQLQKSCSTIEGKDSELAKSKGENRRLELELEQMKVRLGEEKKCREQLELRLQEGKATVISTDDDDVQLLEYKKEISRLNNCIDEKDDQLSVLSEEMKKLRHDIRIFKNERKSLLKRENEMEDNFAKSYRGSISMMESRVTRSSATQEARITELESKLLEERSQRKEEYKQREEKLKEVIRSKCDELAELQGRMDEARLARETCLEEARQQRKKYGETIGELQEALEKALEEYSEIKDKFEKEHDPKIHTKIQKLEDKVQELETQNNELEAQLEECEKVKDAEKMKAQEMNHLVQSLGESVQSLRQQKEEIFESTREFLRQSQDSEALKGAQKVLEEQLCKAQDNLDATKHLLYEEKQKNSQLAMVVESAKKESEDVRRVVRVLTESKEQAENELKKQEDVTKSAEMIMATLDTELKEIRKSNTRQTTLIQELEQKVESNVKDLEATLDLLKETKCVKERLEGELSCVQTELSACKKELEGVERLQSNLLDMEIIVKEKECQIEEKVQEVEAAKMKAELLTENCQVLENQLKRLETLVAKKEEELEAAGQNSFDLSEKLSSMEELLKETKKEVNEAKSLQVFAEKQLSIIKNEKANDDENKCTLISQLNEEKEEFRNRLDEKLSELNGVMGQLEQLKEEKTLLECLNNELKRKHNIFDKEITRYLDSIVSMKEQIINLKTDLHEAKQKAEFYRERATVLMEEKELVEMDGTQREAELQATIHQQAKLVQFFQNQAQLLSAKKKKFRFFSREKETELPAPPTELIKCATLPTTSYVPRTPLSCSKTPRGVLTETKNIPKMKFDEEDFSDDEQGGMGDVSGTASES